jgi:hypothetical protein
VICVHWYILSVPTTKLTEYMHAYSSLNLPYVALVTHYFLLLRALDAYIYNYLISRNMTATAQSFAKETQEEAPSAPDLQSNAYLDDDLPSAPFNYKCTHLTLYATTL